MSSGRTDVELLHAHAAGDTEAFGELVRRHQDRLWSVALGTLRNPDDAADAVQDALLSAYRAVGSYRGEAQVTTWLHRIVVNACLDRLRRQRVRPVTALQDSGPQEPAEPRDRIAERDTTVTVRAALAELGADQQAAITLVDLYGYSVVEAALILDVAEGTVKSRCARGRLQLARLLGRLDSTPDHAAPEPAATRGNATAAGRVQAPTDDRPGKEGGP